MPPAHDETVSPDAPRRAVLFADVSDSSRLYRELGDVRARAAIVAALAVARRAVEGRGGRVLDEIGDELFCEFGTAGACRAAAVGVQTAIVAARESGEVHGAIRFRIGFAYGPVGLDGGRIFGDTVYLAQRVASMAKPEQVLTTADTLRSLGAATAARVVDVVRPKGRTEAVELIELLWGDDHTLEPDEPAAGSGPAPARWRIDLVWRDRSIAVDDERPAATLGRDENCDLKIDDGRVSRLHARVELSRGGVRWSDLSRNGSYLEPDGGEERAVLRGAAPLDGAGTVRLGPDRDAPRVTYSVREVTP